MRKLKRFTRPKVLLPTLIIAAIIAAAVSAILNLNSPAQGTIVTPDIGSKQLAKQDTSNKHYSDNVINFDYPYNFQVSPTQKQNGYLDAVNLITTQRQDEYVSIGVYQGDISSDSGVSYRRSHPDLYSLITDAANQKVYQKTDKTEYTGFIQKAQDVITISFTSVAPKDMSGEYQTIANSI